MFTLHKNDLENHVAMHAEIILMRRQCLKEQLLRQSAGMQHLWFNPRPRRVVASLDKMINAAYLYLAKLTQAVNYLDKMSRNNRNLDIENLQNG